MESLVDPAIHEILKMGVVFTMFVVITYILCKAVKTLYDRNQAMADSFLRTIAEHTNATNNLASKIERIGDARKD